jgi:hypothetical protein
MRYRIGGFLGAVVTAMMLAAAASAQAPEVNTPDQSLRWVRDWVFKGVVAGTPSRNSSGSPDGQRESAAGREDLVAAALAEMRACIALESDPVQRIVERSRATNIVIINEDHGAPLDRFFIAQVLRALAAEGYSIYAAETFTQYNSLVHDDVLATDGWYSNEPMFGRTMRVAKSLGYKLVAYEETQDQERASAAAQPTLGRINRRETAQAENLMRAIFKDQPDAKVLIHVGHGHVLERTRPGSTSKDKWVAERVKEATGRDPLTISQTDCRSTTTSTVIAETRLGEDGKAEAGSAVDLYVGHPPLTFRDGRPAWRQEAGDKPTTVPAQFINPTERVIVEARPEGASLGSVPIDRVLLFPGENLPLLLPPGRYQIDGYLPTGRVETAPVVVDVQ